MYFPPFLFLIKPHGFHLISRTLFGFLLDSVLSELQFFDPK